MTVISKNDLIKEITQNLEGVSQKQTQEIVDNFLNKLVENVANNNKVQIVDFGTFEQGHSAARTGRNPRTGEALQISAKDYPKFKPSKKFKETVNK